MRPLSLEEVALLASGAANERDALCIKIGAFIGLRGGEVGGLRVEDIDPVANRVHVRQNATLTSQGRRVGSLKTRASRRSLPVAPSLVQEAQRYIESVGPADDGLVFHTSRGMVLTAWELLWRRWWKLTGRSPRALRC